MMTDDELREQFENQTMPFEQWTHRAHVRMAWIYVTDPQHTFDDACDAMRRGVKTYNAANDVPESPTTGYNETTTIAFMHIIYAVYAAYQPEKRIRNSNEFCDIHPQLLNKHILRLFYSPERRVLPEAKTTFVEPDLAPLPRVM